MQERSQDRGSGKAQGGVSACAEEDLQVRHQAGAEAGARARVRGCTQGGLCNSKTKPQDGHEAIDQEVVLHSNTMIRRQYICVFEIDINIK